MATNSTRTRATRTREPAKLSPEVLEPSTETTVQTEIVSIPEVAEQAVEQATEQVAEQVEETSALAPTEAAVIQLPPDDAAVVGHTPIRAYKNPFQPVTPATANKPVNFTVSDDGGTTNEDSGTSKIIGFARDMLLLVTPADENASYALNYRLRFLMSDTEGRAIELNFNAVSYRPDGSTGVTGPVRSFLGALAEICQSEDDSRQLFDVCRIDLRNGKRARFLEISVPTPDRKSWMKLSDNSWYNGPSTIEELLETVKRIKRAFQGYGLMPAGSAAVAGEQAYYDTTGQQLSTVDATADTVLDDAGF